MGNGIRGIRSCQVLGFKNLIDWAHLSDWGKEYGGHDGVWECPDLFPINVEGSDEKKWVLLLSINPVWTPWRICNSIFRR